MSYHNIYTNIHNILYDRLIQSINEKKYSKMWFEEEAAKSIGQRFK